MSKRGERLRKGVTQHIEGIPAELGRLESTGAYTVPTGQLNEVYARLYGDPNNLVTAIDLISSRKARLPVRLQLNASGRYVVIGVDPLPANEFLGADAASGNMPPVRGSSVNAVWESHQFNPGRIRALNGSDLKVYMEALPYGDSDLGGVSGDMTTVVGTITSGKKAWIAVAVDPTTNVLSFTKGTEYALPVPIGTRVFAVAVATPAGEIPLWAYLIRAGATYVPVQPTSPDSLYFVDRRSFVQPQASSPVLPNRLECFADTFNQPDGATGINYEYSASQPHGFVCKQSTQVDGDSFTFSGVLQSGAYTLRALGATGNDRGIVDWYVNGDLQGGSLTGQDWYSGSTVYETAKTGTITVLADGNTVIKGVINGKNGSSGDYYWALTKVSIIPATD